MAGYYEAFTGLSRSLTVLLTAEPAPGEVSPAAHIPEVLAARDVVTSEVAALIRRLLDAGPASDQDLRLGHLVTDPGHVLHAALYDLPRCSAGFADDRRWLTGATDWSRAARAAATLEHDHERLAALPGPAAWAVLRDAADLAAALPYLDADLAAGLPAGHDPARAALTAPGPHALVRVAAGELREQLRDLPAGRPGELLDPTPPGPIVLGSPADLPEGMRRLAAVLTAHVDQVAAVDVRAVARVLAAGVETVRGDPVTPTPARAALGRVLAGLRDVQTAPWDTMTRPDWRLQALTTEAYRQLPRPTGSGDASLLWAPELPRVVCALAGAVERTATAGRIAVPRDHVDAGRHRALLWVPLPADAKDHPLLAGLRSARSAAMGVQETLNTAHGGEVSPARRAALAAGRAAADLRAALAERRPGPPPTNDRPTHPARRQGWAEQQRPHLGR